jgi:hypothetical protein
MAGEFAATKVGCRNVDPNLLRWNHFAPRANIPSHLLRGYLPAADNEIRTANLFSESNWMSVGLSRHSLLQDFSGCKLQPC